MEKMYALNGKKRKDLCAVIAQVTGESVNYLGVPSYAYEVGEVRVDKDSRVTNLTEEVHQALLEAGFEDITVTQEQPQKTEVGSFISTRIPLTITMPLLEEADLQKLDNLLVAKGPLIQKALEADQLTYTVDEDKVVYRWFNEIPRPEILEASTVFISKIHAFVQERHRISRKVTITDNEKYTFRTFLLALGMIGPEYKEVRKILLENLSGNSAFRHPKERNNEES